MDLKKENSRRLMDKFYKAIEESKFNKIYAIADILFDRGYKAFVNANLEINFNTRIMEV